VSLQWCGTRRRDIFTLPVVVGCQQARRPGQTVVTSTVFAASTETATSRRQETVVHRKSVKAQVPGGLGNVLVTGRQWASLLGCEQRREAENHTAAGHVYVQRHKEEARTVFGKPKSRHSQNFRSTDRRYEQGVPDVFGRRHGTD